MSCCIAFVTLYYILSLNTIITTLCCILSMNTQKHLVLNVITEHHFYFEFEGCRKEFNNTLGLSLITEHHIVLHVSAIALVQSLGITYDPWTPIIPPLFTDNFTSRIIIFISSCVLDLMLRNSADIPVNWRKQFPDTRS